MKNLVLAILIALLITYSFGHVATDWLDVSIHLDDHPLTSVESIAGISIAGIIMAIIGFVVAVSVIGVVFVAMFAVIVGLLFAGLSVFWPMLLVLAVVIWLAKDRRPAQ